MTVRANLVFVASLFPVVTHGEDCHGKACHVEAVNRSKVDAGTEVEASEIGIVITGIGMQFAEKTDGEYVVQLNVAFTIGKHVFRNFVAVNGSLVQVIIKEGVKETRLDIDVCHLEGGFSQECVSSLLVVVCQTVCMQAVDGVDGERSEFESGFQAGVKLIGLGFL